MISAIPKNFKALPDVDGRVIVLSWDICNVDTSIPFNMSSYEKQWSGRVRLVKHTYGYVTNPYASKACVLFDTELTEATTYYFVDNGGTLSDYTDVLPVTNLDDWTHLGTGLSGGIRYYYTLFVFDIDGNYTYIPSYIFSSSYAFAKYGHARYIKNLLPHCDWKQDTTRDLASFISVIGKHFDSVKTDIDRLAYINDPEFIDADLLPLLEQLLDWPIDTTLDYNLRRTVLLNAVSKLQKKGRVDNLLDVIQLLYNYRPIVHREYKSIAFSNSWGSPTVTPIRIESIDYDFGTKTELVTTDIGSYYAEMGIKKVSKLYLPKGFDWPTFNSYFVGNQIYIASLSTVAICVAYDATDLYIILDKDLAIDDTYTTEYPQIQILLGCPAINNSHANTDLISSVFTRKYALQHTPNIDTSLVPSGLCFIVAPTSLDPCSNIGSICTKLHLLKEYLLSATATITVVSKDMPYVEHVTSPTETIVTS